MSKTDKANGLLKYLVFSIVRPIAEAFDRFQSRLSVEDRIDTRMQCDGTEWLGIQVRNNIEHKGQYICRCGNHDSSMLGYRFSSGGLDGQLVESRSRQRGCSAVAKASKYAKFRAPVGNKSGGERFRFKSFASFWKIG